jgi:hypothetical protein
MDSMAKNAKTDEQGTAPHAVIPPEDDASAMLAARDEAEAAVVAANLGVAEVVTSMGNAS